MAEYELPDDCLYTREDEWVRPEGSKVTIGITDYAQDQLGDIVFVELPEVGTTLSLGETFGVIESVKAVSDLFAPVSGSVVETNGELGEAPDAINSSCYADGWMLVVELSDPDELDSLMSPEAYTQHIKERDD